MYWYGVEGSKRPNNVHEREVRSNAAECFQGTEFSMMSPFALFVLLALPVLLVLLSSFASEIFIRDFRWNKLLIIISCFRACLRPEILLFSDVPGQK